MLGDMAVVTISGGSQILRGKAIVHIPTNYTYTHGVSSCGHNCTFDSHICSFKSLSDLCQ